MGSQTSVPPKGTPGAQPANPLMNFVPMIVVILILYVLIIRPQQRQAKEHKKMVDQLKAGDRVLTQGGIYGFVAAIKGGVVQVRIADNVRIDVARSAITQVILEPSNGSAAPAVGEKTA